MNSVPDPIILEIYFLLEETDRVRFYRFCKRFRNIIRGHYINYMSRTKISGLIEKCQESDVLGASIMVEQIPGNFALNLSAWIDPDIYSESEKQKIRCFIIATRSRYPIQDHRLLYRIMILDEKITSEEIEDRLKEIWSGCVWEYDFDPNADIITHIFIKVSILFRNYSVLGLIFTYLQQRGIIRYIIGIHRKALYESLKVYKEIKGIPDQYLDLNDPIFDDPVPPELEESE